MHSDDALDSDTSEAPQGFYGTGYRKPRLPIDDLQTGPWRGFVKENRPAIESLAVEASLCPAYASFAISRHRSEHTPRCDNISPKSAIDAQCGELALPAWHLNHARNGTILVASVLNDCCCRDPPPSGLSDTLVPTLALAS